MKGYNNPKLSRIWQLMNYVRIKIVCGNTSLKAEYNRLHALYLKTFYELDGKRNQPTYK